MPEYTQTGRASLRLVDPDGPVVVDPFALPAPRYRPGTRPGLVLTRRTTATPPVSAGEQVAGFEQTPPREKPS